LGGKGLYNINGLMGLFNIGPFRGGYMGNCPNGLVLMKFEHLRLCSGGGEDGSVLVRWWWMD